MNFKLKLKELMEEKNVTQVELAKNISVSQIAVSKWLNGKNEATASSLIEMSKFFGVSTDYLLGLVDDFNNLQIKNEMTKDEKEILKFYRESGNAGKKCIYIYSSGVYAAHKESLKL